MELTRAGIRPALIAAIFALSCGVLHAETPGEIDLAAMEAAILDGQAKSVYPTLLAVEMQRAGDRDYDYLLGLAALEAGHPGQATLIFERVLAVDPNHAAARLDMGRAYFALGDETRALSEFETVSQLDPPPSAIATIEKYRKIIADRERTTRMTWTGYIEGAYGHDSNINQATHADSVFLPATQSVWSLDDGGNLGDSHWSAAAGLEGNYSLSRDTRMFGGIDLRGRRHSQEKTYDSDNADLRGGLQTQHDANTWRLSGNYGEYQLDGAPYRKLAGLTADWRRSINSRNQLTLFGQYLLVRYQVTNLVANNVNVSLVGGGWTRLVTDHEILVHASVFSGKESTVNNRDDGNKQFGGFRIASQVTLGKLDIIASIGAQRGQYDKANSLYLTQRVDTQYDISLTPSWRFSPGWSLRPGISMTKNDSNLSIFRYVRHELTLAIRRDFR